MTTLSYAHGPATIPLRGQTIGEALAACVEAHGDRDAVVSCHEGIRLYLPRSSRTGPSASRWRCSRRASSAATGSASGRRTAPSGSWSSTRPRASARSSSTSTRPTGSTSSTSCCGQSGQSLLLYAPGFKGVAYRPLVEAADAPGPARVDRARQRGLGRVPGRRRRRRHRSAGGARGRADVRPADQHPVHVGHDGVPQGRDALAPQHPQQRPQRRRRCAATTRPTASACRCRSTTASAW